MPEGGKAANFINYETVLVDGWSEHASNLELLGPGGLLLTKEVVKHLSALVVSSLLGSLVGGLDRDEADGFLGELDTSRHGVRELESE